MKGQLKNTRDPWGGSFKVAAGSKAGRGGMPGKLGTKEREDRDLSY